MRNIFLFTLILFTQYTYAVDMNALVNARNEEHELVPTEVVLTDLLDEEKLEGTFFKIVSKSTNEVIKLEPFSDDKVLMRARNVYYHLTKAKRFFENIGFKQNEQIIIRIGIKDKFSKVAHFKKVAKDEEEQLPNSSYNNAHTYMGGAAEDGVLAWGKEIWFRDPKVIDFTDEQIERTKKTMREQIPNANKFNFNTLINNIIYATISGNPKQYFKSSGETLAINYGTNMVIRYIVPEITMALADKSWFIDMAMIPEVVYHEYSHYVMSDFLPPVINKPIMEGFSDFFSTQITNNAKIAADLSEFGNNILERNAKNNINYQANFDNDSDLMLGQGTAFVLSTLTLLNTYIDERMGEGSFVKILYKSRKHLTINSSISKDLSNAIIREVPFQYRFGVMSILHNVGL